MGARAPMTVACDSSHPFSNTQRVLHLAGKTGLMGLGAQYTKKRTGKTQIAPNSALLMYPRDQHS